MIERSRVRVPAGAAGMVNFLGELLFRVNRDLSIQFHLFTTDKDISRQIRGDIFSS